MVVAEGVGDECRQVARPAKGHCRIARRLAVIMYRMWRDGTQFRWTRQELVPVPAAGSRLNG